MLTRTDVHTETVAFNFVNPYYYKSHAYINILIIYFALNTAEIDSISNTML